MDVTVIKTDRARLPFEKYVKMFDVVPPGMQVPDGCVVMGVPGRVVREVNDADRAYLAKLPGHYERLARRHAEHPDDPRVYTDDELLSGPLPRP